MSQCAVPFLKSYANKAGFLLHQEGNVPSAKGRQPCKTHAPAGTVHNGWHCKISMCCYSLRFFALSFCWSWSSVGRLLAFFASVKNLSKPKGSSSSIRSN